MLDKLATLPLAVMIAAEGSTPTAFDWSTISTTTIENNANAIAGVIIPAIVTISAIPIGVKIFKRLLGKI